MYRKEKYYKTINGDFLMQYWKIKWKLSLDNIICVRNLWNEMDYTNDKHIVSSNHVLAIPM